MCVAFQLQNRSSCFPIFRALDHNVLVQQNAFAVNWHIIIIIIIIIIKYHYRLHAPAHGRSKYKRKYVQNTSVSHQ
jgi:hypothetical protein